MSQTTFYSPATATLSQKQFFIKTNPTYMQGLFKILY